eukprot:tig00000391_g24851.t1
MAEWDGCTLSATLQDAMVKHRNDVHAAGKAGQWDKLLALLEEEPAFVNSSGMDDAGKDLYSPLHWAAELGAPKAVVEKLVKMRAWRSLRNLNGETAEDVARRTGRPELADQLKPAKREDCPEPEVLKSLQKHFHDVIRARCKDLCEEHALRLPEIEPLTEILGGGEDPDLAAGASWYFTVPGMYGGFSYRLADVAGDPCLVAESWCRVAEGSGQRHLVTPFGSVLLAEGFV